MSEEIKCKLCFGTGTAEYIEMDDPIILDGSYELTELTEQHDKTSNCPDCSIKHV